MNPHAGMILGNRYTLTDRVASGGMGDVWQAADLVLGRTVALKVMRPNADDEPTFADRFRDEARHTASLSHPNIATVYDYGEDDGAAYLVMELVHGQPLSRIIAQGPVTPEQTRSVVGQAALALAAAHAAGVVHRDVKPANILVTDEGQVKLTDFGISRATDSAAHTRTGEVLGTPHYLAPEQALGRQATGATDLYALGVVTHEMLTGTKPFDAGSPVATALSQVHDTPPPLPATIPADLRSVVTACLAKDPAARPTSAADVAASLGMPVGGLAALSPAATSVLPTTPGADSRAAQYLPAPAPVPASTAVLAPAAQAWPTERVAPAAPPPPERRRGGGGGWWWLPVILGLVAVALLLWQLLNPGQDRPQPAVTSAPATSSAPLAPAPTGSATASVSPSSAPTTPAPAPTTPPAPAPTTPPPAPTTPPPAPTTPPPAPVQTVNIQAKDFVGKQLTQIAPELASLGFTTLRVQQVPGKEPRGTVTSISPTGLVTTNTPLLATVSDGSGTPPKDTKTKGAGGG